MHTGGVKRDNTPLWLGWELGTGRGSGRRTGKRGPEGAILLAVDAFAVAWVQLLQLREKGRRGRAVERRGVGHLRKAARRPPSLASCRPPTQGAGQQPDLSQRIAVA